MALNQTNLSVSSPRTLKLSTSLISLICVSLKGLNLFVRSYSSTLAMDDCRVNVDLNPTFGVQFWGLLVSIFLLGASLVQSYIYYVSNSDGWFMRTFVSIIITLDTAVSFLASDAMHFYLITSFGNAAPLSIMTRTYIAEIIGALTVILMSQHFYATRVYAAGGGNGGKIAAIIISFISLVSFGAGLAINVRLLLTGRHFMSLQQPGNKSLVGTWSIVNGLCDAVATFCMCYFLSSFESSVKSTKSVLNSLILFSINRGFLVFFSQMCFAVAYLVVPTKGYWSPFHFIVPKLHLNTLLAMLNSRSKLRSRIEGRINVIEGSGLPTVIDVASPIRLRHIASSEQSEVFQDRANKNTPQVSEVRHGTESERNTADVQGCVAA